MLVLDRRVQEGFWIEGGIYVKVLGVGRKRVKLGIQAPPDLKIVRDELMAPGETEHYRHAPTEGEGEQEGSLRSLRRRN